MVSEYPMLSDQDREGAWKFMTSFLPSWNLLPICNDEVLTKAHFINCVKIKAIKMRPAHQRDSKRSTPMAYFICQVDIMY